MPLPALSPAEKTEAGKGAESDLKWLLSDSGVEDDVQEVLLHFKVWIMQMFLLLTVKLNKLVLI